MPAGQAGMPIADALGYRLFAPGEMPGYREAIAECRGLFDRARGDGTLQANLERNAKRFLVPVQSDKRELLGLPAIRDAVLSPQVVRTVSDYFGAIPILSTVSLLWTPPNNTMEKSQKFHFDTEDTRQLKIFLSVFDIDGDCGPLTLVPAAQSDEIRRAAGYVGGRRTRLDDEAVVNARPDVTVQVMGPAGGGVFLDTSRCLHFGSRFNRRERLVLMAQFIGYYAPKLAPVDWRPAIQPVATNLNREQRMLLRV